MANTVVDTRGTYQLAYNNTLSTVNHKGTGICHQGQVAHEYLVFVHFIFIFIVQSYLYLKWCGVSCIPFFTLLDGIFNIILTQCKVNEFQTQMSCKVCYRRDIIKRFPESFVEEPLVGVFLNLNQVWHLKNFFLS